MLSTKGKFAETQLLPGLLHEFMKALAPSSGLETSGLQRRKMMGFRWTSLGHWAISQFVLLIKSPKLSRHRTLYK